MKPMFQILRSRILWIALFSFGGGSATMWFLDHRGGHGSIVAPGLDHDTSHPPAAPAAGGDTNLGLPREPTGFIAGVDQADDGMRANHVIPICALVTIPPTATKYVKFGFIHLADPSTIYPLGETAQKTGRQKFTACTSRASYSARSELILFSYRKDGEALLQRAIESGFAKSGVAIPSIPGFEVLAVDGPDILNLKAY